MPESAKQDAGLRMLKFMAAALLVWGCSYVAASKILERHPRSAWLRGAAVALGTFGFLTWLFWSAKAIRVENEFTRQIHLVALALAFGATAIFIFVCDMLRRAAFMDYVSLMTIFLFMVGAWLFSIMLASWYYR